MEQNNFSTTSKSSERKILYGMKTTFKISKNKYLYNILYECDYNHNIFPIRSSKDL